MVYYAKSPDKDGHQVTCQEHISSVAALAAKFGSECGLEYEAGLCGFLHDFGKYSECFQDVLNKTRQNIDHAFAGAVILNRKARANVAPFQNAIEVIAAHHDGLYSYPVIRTLLERLLNDKNADSGISDAVPPSGKICSLAGMNEYKRAYTAFKQDFPDFRLTVPSSKTYHTQKQDCYAGMLKSRMLLSCLADADYSVSGGINDCPSRPLPAQEILSALYHKLKEKRRSSDADTTLNKMRDDVFYICGEMGRSHDSIFTLTAPTGIGKTYALLHFALRYCIENKKSRIIVVLPFLSISDQTEKVYGELIPDMLVDNSGREPNEDNQLCAERWDSPFIITTSVKFFELLFQSHPTELRKLHHVADSVVIFDEAQTLPPSLAEATLHTLYALCRDYRTGIVFSTATQPDYSAVDTIANDWKPTEILKDHERYYKALRRVRVLWEIDTPTDMQTIASRMAESDNVCAIVNTRKQAVSLFSELRKCFPEQEESLFMMSTDLCPAHRKNIIDTVKLRQKNRQPCRVVSTQCMEAGVDLDFAVMFRALAPLEAVIQAAGRCNRNGRLPDGGLVTVFLPEEEYYPEEWYCKCAGVVKEMKMSADIDINSTADIRRYYLMLDRSENKKLSHAIEAENYADTATEYHLIENRGFHVIVPYQKEQKLFRQIADAAGKNGMTKELMRLSAPITVPYLPQKDTDLEYYAEKIPYPQKYGKSRTESTDSGYFILRPQFNCYSEQFGLQLVGENRENAENMGNFV